MAYTYLAHPPKMGRNIAGERFGRLIILGLVERIRRPGRSFYKIWHCRCDCGKEVLKNQNWIMNGSTQSCGCLKTWTTKARCITHGLSGSTLYATWVGMRQRCENPDNKAYENYGARGIRVEEPWNTSFQAFHDDMNKGWEPGLTIDRINNDGNYCKENCRWATKITQAINTRVNCWIEFRGERKLRRDWATAIGITDYALASRLKNGWSIERALLTPKTPQGGGR